MILMLIKYESLKKNHMAQIMHLNTLLDIMTMMPLEHYIQNFQKWLVILIYSMKIKIKIKKNKIK